MFPITAFGLTILCGYLVGSLPFGLLIARAKGVDIRSVGSGNIGATNVFRSVGKGWGLLTFALDFAKGLLPTLAPSWWLGSDFSHLSLCMLAGGIAAILGHSFSCFIKFAGGKGVATSAGVIMGLAPMVLLIGLGTWMLLLLLSRMVSLGSIGAAIAVAAAAWWLRPGDEGLSIPIALTLMALLIVVRHRSNIGRILNGGEPRVRFTKS